MRRPPDRLGQPVLSEKEVDSSNATLQALFGGSLHKSWMVGSGAPVRPTPRRTSISTTVASATTTNEEHTVYILPPIAPSYHTSPSDASSRITDPLHDSQALGVAANDPATNTTSVTPPLNRPALQPHDSQNGNVENTRPLIPEQVTAPVEDTFESSSVSNRHPVLPSNSGTSLSAQPTEGLEQGPIPQNQDSHLDYLDLTNSPESTNGPSVTTPSFHPNSSQPQSNGQNPDNSHPRPLKRQRLNTNNTQSELSLSSKTELIDEHIRLSGGKTNLNYGLERPRFQLLREACVEEDIFYVAMHQLFCVWDYDRQLVLQIPGLPTLPSLQIAFRILGQLIRDNDRMAPNHKTWFARFPMPLPDLLHKSSYYREAVQNVGIFLSKLSSNWSIFTKDCLSRGHPPLVYELVNRLGVLSGRLQGVIFTATRRNLGIVDAETGSQVEAIFHEDLREYCALHTRLGPNLSPTNQEVVDHNRKVLTAHAKFRKQERPHSDSHGVVSVTEVCGVLSSGSPVVGSAGQKAVLSPRLRYSSAPNQHQNPSAIYAMATANTTNRPGQQLRESTSSSPSLSISSAIGRPSTVNSHHTPHVQGNSLSPMIMSQSVIQNLYSQEPISANPVASEGNRLHQAEHTYQQPGPNLSRNLQTPDLPSEHPALRPNYYQIDNTYRLQQPPHQNATAHQPRGVQNRAISTSAQRTVYSVENQHAHHNLRRSTSANANVLQQLPSQRVFLNDGRPDTSFEANAQRSMMQSTNYNGTARIAINGPNLQHNSQVINSTGSGAANLPVNLNHHAFELNASQRRFSSDTVVPQRLQRNGPHHALRTSSSSPTSAMVDALQAYILTKPLSRNLIPPHGFIHPVQQNNPVFTALHKAHLRSPRFIPIHKFPKDVPEQHNCRRFYQIAKEFTSMPVQLLSSQPITTYEFRVSEEHFRVLATTQPSVRGEPPTRPYTAGTLQFRLRCVQQEKASAECTVADWVVSDNKWPERGSFDIRIGNMRQQLDLRRKIQFGKDLPVDLTAYFRGPCPQAIITYSSPGRRSHLEDFKYLFAVETIEILSHAQILSYIQKSQHISTSTTLDAISKTLSSTISADNDDDITLVSSELSIGLVDPFSSRLIGIPVRGISCQHRECFDLETFLLSRLSRTVEERGPNQPSLVDVWKCPLCNKDARPYSLYIDDFLLEVLEALKALAQSDVKAIWVKEDGQWRPREDSKPNERKRFHSDSSDDDAESLVILKAKSGQPAVVIDLDDN